METFRFRLNCIDHYQATPTDLDPVLRRGPGPAQRHNAPSVPVIRVFGATETGQKVCAHIHGALPYLYLEYSGSVDQKDIDAYISDLRASIDHALATAYHRNPYDGRSVYVGHISLVKGVPFFGYNVGYRLFLKVYLLNPLHMTRFVDLLHQGTILNHVFQTYESHLQYLLQWMCDYNLYGCAYIDCAKVQFRTPVPSGDYIDPTSHAWHDASIPPEFLADSDQYPRQSHCTLEVDVCVQDILNRHEVRARPIHHDFLERTGDLHADEKYVPSMAGLWRDETRRRRRQMGLSDSSSSPFPNEALVSMSADPRNSDNGRWMHEAEYRELVDELIRGEKGSKPEARFEAFVKQPTGMEHIRTAVESREELYPEVIASQGASGETLSLQESLQSGQDISAADEKTTSNFSGDSTVEKAIAVEGRLNEEPNYLDPLSTAEARLFENLGDDGAAGGDVDEGIDMDGDRHPPISQGLQSSRKRPPGTILDEPSKRQKLFGSSQANVRRVTFHEEQLLAPRRSAPQHDEGEPPPSNQYFQASIMAHGLEETTLAFPVVKDPHSPGTALRLSQSGYSNSQEGPKTPAAKKFSLKDSQESPVTPRSHQKYSPFVPFSSSFKAQGEAIALVEKLEESYDHKSTTLYFGSLPPTFEDVEKTITDAGMPSVIYQDPYYSNAIDVPERPRQFGGREFKLQSTTLPYLPIFDPSGLSPANYGEHDQIVLDHKKYNASNRYRSKRCSLRHWEIAALPPSYDDVEKWLEQDLLSIDSKPEKKAPSISTHLSQIDGPTQKNRHGFKFTQKKKMTSVRHETQYMSIMSLEVHVNSRGSLVPDPGRDEIQCIFWCIQGEEGAENDEPLVGILCLSGQDGIANRINKQVSAEVEYEEEELDLINRIVDIVRRFDPDILTGYEVHNSSWGYLIERAGKQFDYDLCDELSRMKSQSKGKFGKEADRWGYTHTSTIHVTGRHIINIWRAMRGELNLLQYTMENVVFHLLHKRIPHYQHADLTAWYTSKKPRDLAKVLEYFISRVRLNLDILEANEIISRTSEQARLLGVDFFSVISRGSQFKVESTMFRIAKPENFILVSPSRQQVGRQNALECLPLVMEPKSAFYSSPLLVMDFQSLYPSVMIAYNYCYSTCLGRIVDFRGRNKLGFMDFKREPQLLELVKDHINIAPNGMMYVKPEMRKSLLAKMLGEILETRVMVKSGMKADKDDKTLQQLLNNRQLALKLLANVTYGYTSASFSGRMPCSEIADSIVQTGRETLEKAIAFIHATKKWGAEVVYGDTDSLFIYLKGRTRDEAFTVGEEIAEAVTNINPRPIKLKFEKVYHPCVLMAKKRYVGFKYESRNQQEPEFDAKGIETVRRDGTPAEQKIEETALKILFRTSDLSEVKRYFQSQCTKIMTGRVSIQDFLFAKEVKLGTYSERGMGPPGAHVAAKRMIADPRTEPQYGERVPYVVITGAPGARLVDRCVDPEVLLRSNHIELDAEYYISKNLIPPLERIFNLMGASVRQWYDEVPKIQRMRPVSLPLGRPQTGIANFFGGRGGGGGSGTTMRTLESYMTVSVCLLCRAKLPPPPPRRRGVEPTALSQLPLCRKCLKRPARTLLALKDRVWKEETKIKEVDMVCRNCSNLPWGDEIRCDSRDCPVFYTRIREQAKLAGLKQSTSGVIEVLENEYAEAKVKKSGRSHGISRNGLEW
ncbi:hypothetical protein BS50DRAFT_571548 [Corynespora cassiicola Philippines]|uniref:DNA polymerase n=1 Tax=Corynespora cassiicola Philippines TaxID=1448308 RepID=A0A2T2NYB3_CORCC|nr:hypothetical protein BS50DRAFT_571548 [Corynespora cassiicola Philippines]